LQEILRNRFYEGKQRVTVARPYVSAPSAWKTLWKSIDWQIVYEKVHRQQVGIAKAAQEGRWGKVNSLQGILVRSRCARLLAVRRVTTNKGKRTPGVDGVLWNTPRKKIEAAMSLSPNGYKPSPLKRTYVPKKNGKRRPLGIPTMKDRAVQALFKMALEPVAETLADRNSYGFRPRRSTADALSQCFIVLAKKDSPTWIWEADIEACFDNISHDWMLENIPMDKGILRKWLKAGYIEGNVLYPTEKGTPQGGLISPVLANMVLDGLEETARNAVPKRIVRRSTRSKVHVIRYADDFLITAHSRELLEEKIIPAVVAFLKERGLNISAEKSKITDIKTGFKFLGASIRKYGTAGKFLIRPSKDNLLSFIEETREYIRSHLWLKTEHLIHQLNSRIRGWTNYFRPLCSSRAFRKLDSEIFNALWIWARRRHDSKGHRWVAKRYFHTHRKGLWVFFAPSKDKAGRPCRLKLVKASCTTIRRHVKIRAGANVFNPDHADYFAVRRQDQRRARQADYKRRKQWEREEAWEHAA
jgi:RNA-directed DNA polymerase